MIQPGDVLLYRPTGVFGRVIAVKTWHRISHVEVALSASESVASRDGIGVGRYAHRSQDLAHVLRPRLPVDLAVALRWFTTVEGQPYGWLDLLAFIGLKSDGPGMVCSPFATEFLRAGGLPIFNGEPARYVAPFEFLLSELLMDVTNEAGIGA